MKSVLITGATGNVGQAVLKHIDTTQLEVFSGVRDVEKAKKKLARDDIRFIEFDFESGLGYDQIHKFDILFLLRPPHIGDVKRFIFPLLKEAQEQNTAVVFLSVQGADKKGFIPHAKVEAEIGRLGIPHIFLRPSYFMENLITTLADELKINKRIYMPSKDLKFNWISVDSIGKAAAECILNSQAYLGQNFELTTDKNVGFKEIINMINGECGTNFTYESPSPFTFAFYKRKQNESWGYIGVLLLLHFLPRFEKEPNVTNDFQHLTREQPESLNGYIKRNKKLFIDMFQTK